MLAQTITMDSSRRITLPERILDALGITIKDEILLEMTNAGVLIKPKRATPLTDRLASMNLPVSDWEQMKKEIEVGSIS